MVAVSAFLAFINPYDAAASMSYPFAFLYWFGMVATGGVAGSGAIAIFERLFPNGPRLLTLAVGAVIATFAVMAFIIAFTLAQGFYIPLIAIPRLFGLILVISIAITAMNELMDRAFNDERITAAASDGVDPVSTFMERLPVKFRTSQLQAISSEDHYLRVHTNLGEELILMRLADAVRELEGADGTQVHRSWWVAKSSIADEKRENGRSVLVLQSGTEVPVSRSYRAKAKELGLIA